MHSPDHLPPASPTPPKVADPFAGSVQLFRLAGTAVYVHWTWLLVGFELMGERLVPYSSRAWDAAELVAVFGIVLLHEFGHVVACRWVGGTAERVVLWPLGGLAFVSPPPRAGAEAVTTACGPLVNVALAPVLYLLAAATGPDPEAGAWSDLGLLLDQLEWANRVMLVFNLLPIYPLDGGRLLHAALWRVAGAGPGLVVAGVLGVAGAVGLGALAVLAGSPRLAILAAFLGLQAAVAVPVGMRQARVERDARRRGFETGSAGRDEPSAG